MTGQEVVPKLVAHTESLKALIVDVCRIADCELIADAD